MCMCIGGKIPNDLKKKITRIHEWTGNEVELLLKVALEYKVYIQILSSGYDRYILVPPYESVRIKMKPI